MPSASVTDPRISSSQAKRQRGRTAPPKAVVTATEPVPRRPVTPLIPPGTRVSRARFNSSAEPHRLFVSYSRALSTMATSSLETVGFFT